MYKPIFNKRNVLKFTHFTNKGYALFACLGREVVIGTLSVATLQHATASSVSTEVDNITTDTTTTGRIVQLEGVNVTGTRAPLTLSQQARMVTVLSREDIQAAAVQSVNDLLKLAVGVDVRQRGAIGAQTDVSVRGGNYEQITLLLNGINICDPQTGHNAFDFPVDISDIERIEVLEGPAGRTYGTSSLLGAINIVTKTHARGSERAWERESAGAWEREGERAGERESEGARGRGSERAKERTTSASVHAESGSYGYFSAGGRLSISPANSQLSTDNSQLSIVNYQFSHSLSASYTRSDGYTRNKAGSLNSGYQGGKAFYEGKYVDNGVSVGWQAGLSAKGFGSNTFYGAKWDDQYEDILKTFAAVQAETRVGRVRFRPAVYWNHTEDRFELFHNAPEKYPYNYHRTNVYGANLNSWFDWALGRTAVGAELRNEDLVSGNLGEPLDHKKHIHGTDRDYEYGLNRTNISLIVEHNVILERFTLSAGLIAVSNNWADMGWRIYPGIDAAYRIGRDWKVTASYNTSLRMPSATELYYSVGGHQADKHLKPEELAALEGSVRYQGAAVDGKLSVFYNHYRNLIDWIRHTDEGEDAPWQSVNFGHINAVGVETAVALNLRSLLPQQQVLRRLSVAYCHIRQRQGEEQGIQSKYALEYLRNKLVAELQLSLWRQLSLGVSYRLQDRTGTYTDVDGNVCNYATYGVLDAKLTWEQPRYKVYIEGNNLLDKTYVDYGNVPQPGCWVIAGAALSF